MAGPYVVCGLGGERIMNYFSRFIIGTGLLVGVLVSGGCRKHTWRDQPLRPEDTALVDAMLILRCNDLQTKAEATREEQEKQINDLNLFFVHKHYPSVANPEVRHYYFSSVDVAKRLKLTNIRRGKYRLYAVANAGGRLCSDSHHPTEPTAVGESMCSMTEDQIKALIAEPWEYDLTRADNLPMSSVDENMEIKWAKHEGVTVDEGDIVPISITLKRKVAKYLLSYEIGSELAGKLKIKSIGVSNVPGRVALFKNSKADKFTDFLDNGITIPVKEYKDPFEGNVPEEDPLVFYLLENMQDPVLTITEPEERNGRNAPTYASYIFLDGEAPDPEDGASRQYGFPIYLGNNMTTNFYVEGNAYYHVHLQLKGLNDVRISSLKIKVIQGFPNPIYVNQPEEAIIEITCVNHFNDLLELVCTPEGANQPQFTVIPITKLPDGSEKEELPLQDVAPDGERFWYHVLETDNQPPYERTVKYKVEYIQGKTSRPIRLSLMLRSRVGTVAIVDDNFTVRN